MTDLLKILTVAALASFGTAGLSNAQETATTEDAPAQATTTEETPLDLSTGEPVPPENQVGRSYIREEHGDWAIRCITAEDGNDPCQLYQLLFDDNDNSVAEISLFALPAGQQAVAGATIAVPLETLLTQQLTLAIDSGQARRYPFTWCAPAGCYARIGLTAADLAAFKRGNQGNLTIVPVAAPKNKVNLAISLKGFTAGYEAVSKLNSN